MGFICFKRRGIFWYGPVPDWCDGCQNADAADSFLDADAYLCILPGLWIWIDFNPDPDPQGHLIWIQCGYVSTTEPLEEIFSQVFKIKLYKKILLVCTISYSNF
jgi:hypothetical protein